MHSGFDHTVGEEQLSSARDSVLAQLDYLVAELLAQDILVDMLPAELLDARPPDGSQSILDIYQLMVQREDSRRSGLLGALSTDNDEAPDATLPNPDEGALTRLKNAMARLVDLRKANLNILSAQDLMIWSDELELGNSRLTLIDYAYQMALEDADSLREISVRLSEIQHLFKRRRSGSNG